MSGGAGRDPLAVLTVDGRALQAVEAATRLLCDWVFRPFRETFDCRSKRRVCYNKGREGSLQENLSLWTDMGHSTSAGDSASFQSSQADILHGRI